MAVDRFGKGYAVQQHLKRRKMTIYIEKEHSYQLRYSLQENLRRISLTYATPKEMHITINWIYYIMLTDINI